MDLTAMAATAVTALVPYLAKGGEKLVEQVSDEVFAKRGEIWRTVKSLFIGDELVTLNLLEKYPTNEDMQKEVAGKLEERLKEKPEVAKQLEELLKQIPASQIKQNTLIQSGDDNIANQDIANSSIRTTRK